MRKPRAFHPTGDQLETREGLSAVGLRAPLFHARPIAPLRLNTPFAQTFTFAPATPGTFALNAPTRVARMPAVPMRMASPAARAAAMGTTAVPNLITGLTFPGAVPGLISGLSFAGAVPGLISGLSFM